MGDSSPAAQTTSAPSGCWCSSRARRCAGSARASTELIAFRALQGLGGGGLIVSAEAAIGDVVFAFMFVLGLGLGWSCRCWCHLQTATLCEARDTLLEGGLIAAGDGTGAAFELTPAGHATPERLTKTGEQRLSDLLRGWSPDEHPDLVRLISVLAREFFVDASALRVPAKEPSAAPAAG